MQPGSQSPVQCAACRQSKVQYAAMQVFNYTMQHAGEVICSMPPCRLEASPCAACQPNMESCSHPAFHCAAFPALNYTRGLWRETSEYLTRSNRPRGLIFGRFQTPPGTLGPASGGLLGALAGHTMHLRRLCSPSYGSSYISRACVIQCWENCTVKSWMIA